MALASSARVRILVSALSAGGIAAAFLFFVAPPDLAADSILGTIPWRAHLAAFTAAVLTLAGRSIRSTILAAVVGEKLDFSTAFQAQVAADAGGLVTPARLGSEAGKLLVLHRCGIRASSGAAINLGEVLWESAGVGFLVLTLFLLLPVSEALPALGSLSYVLGVLAVSFASLFLASRSGDVPSRILVRMGVNDRRWSGLRSFAEGFMTRARLLGRVGAGRGIQILTLTIGTIAVRLAILPLLLGVADSGTTDQVERLTDLLVWPLLLLYGGVLIPLPGGGGAVELGFLLAFRAELPPILLATALFWWRVYTHLLPAAAGWMVLTAGHPTSMVPPRPSPCSRSSD